MSRLVFFLEEPSARKFLLNFLPQIGFQEREHELSRSRAYEGKEDLLKRFAYDLREWGVPGDRFVVLVDNDRNDCRQLKSGILADARKKCRKQSERLRARIACRELEAWYLGDLAALQSVYPDARKIQEPRDPDSLEGSKPSALLKSRISGFSKQDAAEEMGKILGRKCAECPSYYGKDSPDRNRSPSFRCFAKTMAEILQEFRRE